MLFYLGFTLCGFLLLSLEFGFPSFPCSICPSPPRPDLPAQFNLGFIFLSSNIVTLVANLQPETGPGNHWAELFMISLYKALYFLNFLVTLHQAELSSTYVHIVTTRRECRSIPGWPRALQNVCFSGGRWFIKAM